MIKRALTLALLLGLAAAVDGTAQDQGEDGKAKEKKSTYKPFSELTEGAVAREGFFDTYEKDGHLYLAIPRERLDQDFLLVHEIAQGVGARGLFGGSMLDFTGNLVALERHGEKIYLVKRPVQYTAPEDTPEARAVDLGYGSSILETAKIESIREDSALVIDAHDWFVSDLSNISQRIGFAVSRRPGQPGRANFDKGRSYLESVKGFPENLNVRVQLTFKTDGRTPFRSIPDERYLPISIHYTVAKLPETPMEPRVADDRMGYFLTARKNFARKDTSYFVRYARRWRLERAERVGDLWRPKEPIVYHIDPTVPEEYRPYVAEGIEAWNKAFEVAGWKDAMVARPLPENADAEDIRYATIRWNVSDQPSYGAIGPSVTDPRTGEVLDADILIEGQFIMGFRNMWRNMGDPAATIEAILSPDENELEAALAGYELSLFGPQLEAQGGLLRAVLATRGVIEAGEPLPMEFVGQAIKWTVMHEVGHSLGLRHNFKSSHDTPLERLHDRTWAEEKGVVSSVMDYHAPNIAPEGQENGYYYTPAVGSFDEWIIAFGYTPDAERAKALAREAGQPGHTYGTDTDRFFGVDPAVNIYDLAADPLGWAEQRTELTASLIPELPRHVLTDNSSYSDLTGAFQTVLNQYAVALAPAVKFIGGQYVYRTHVGDPGDKGPFVLVPKSEQERALNLLTRRAFAEGALAMPSEVLAKLAPSQWLHWGQSTSFNGRQDYPYHAMVLGLQTSLLNQLTTPTRLARIRDAESKFGQGNVLTIPELFGQLTRTIWSEAWTAPGSDIASTRRDLQRAYIDRMTDILIDPGDQMPADARSVARVTLRDLHERISRRITPPYEFDDYTYAHLSEAKERIEKALEAGLEVEREGG